MSLYPVFADWAKRHGLDAAVSRFAPVLPDEVEAYRQQYESDITKITTGGPPILAASGDEWYSGPNDADIYWPSLQNHLLQHEQWPTERVENVSNASNIVLAHTPRPSRKTWDSRGLVVGYVQSGKTTNFTSVIAKLADEDYRLIIVLSGIHNGLRRQTQERLDSQLKSLNPDRWWTLTQKLRDFPKEPPHEPSAPLTSDKAVLAVVKKNVTVLNRLIDWLSRENGKRALKDARVLVIDDEADQASVATGRINPLITKLLALMPKSTYIGYTATPFANVFIDPTDAEDLYPRNFILNLPRPDGYFGPEKLFGRDVVGDKTSGPIDGYDMVRLVPEADLAKLRPLGKKAAQDFEPTVTDELLDAVRWFWLATAARRCRNDSSHSTMLIHTSVRTDVHEAYKPVLESLQADAIREISSKDAFAELPWRQLWEKESARVPAGDWSREQNTFEELRGHLLPAIEETRIILDNSRSLERLDYSKGSVTAIAVGGNTLSRGLTLEGLVSSFFVRGATAYDTLLQMGRWFGFRTGYEDLPRIWMTKSLEESFRHLSLVEHEMRDDIDRYQREQLDPLDIAVRIRTHPVLRITAKMGAAQPTYISFAGRRLQTRFFRADDADWLASNIQASATLIQDSQRYAAESEQRRSSVLFRDVPVGVVRRFLASYQVHEDSPDLDTGLMIKYIDTQLNQDPPALQDWSVGVVGGTHESADIGGLKVGTINRSRLLSSSRSRADIKTLMNPEDRALDLVFDEGDQWGSRRPGEARLATLRNASDKYSAKGLLLVYPISATSEPLGRDTAKRASLDAEDVVVGIGVVFPGEAQTKNRIRATHVSVDLTDVERVDLGDDLDTDTEDAS